MKFLHLADLHIGKRVNEFSMIEDQKYVFNQVIEQIDKQQADAILIAGDIYDKSMPSAEAVALYDEFLTKLAALKKPICIISGNHDSAERIAFGSKVMEQADIHIAPVFDGTLTKVQLEDVFGEVNVWLLPFIKPAAVRRFYEDEQIEDYTDAVRAVIRHTSIDTSKRNVLVAHQFVTGAVSCESEISIGGLDQVDASVFEPFDYVALGHLHGPQRVGRDTIRYSGTLLKYSFSEINHKKSLTFVTMQEKEKMPQIETIPVQPLHNMRRIEGSYDTLVQRENYINTDLQDYMHVILTDEEDVFDAIGKMRSIYPNIMKLEYHNTRTKQQEMATQAESDTENKSPLQNISDFYYMQNGMNLSEVQEEYITEAIERIWRGSK